MRVLDADAAALVAALAPVVLSGALPADPAGRSNAIAEVVLAFDRAVSGLSPTVQREIGDLLALLAFAPSRIVLAGVSSPWPEAGEEAIAKFLTRWRTSRFDLFRTSYQALVQLLGAAWYGNPLAWSRIGYPGPPDLSGKPPS